MNLERLVNALKRELLRNKAKSAVLGVMVLVALYFWVPVLYRWVRPSSKPAVETTSDPLATANPVELAASGQPNVEPPPNEPPQRWNEVIAWMENNPYTRPATLPDRRPDPFQPVRPPEPVAVQPDPPAPPAAPPAVPLQLSADKLGLVLESTFIGRRFRAAKISGRRYRQHATIVVRQPGEKAQQDRPPLKLELSEIHPEHVVLRAAGHQLVLRLKRPDLGGQHPTLYGASQP